jgi:hypothetical protein
MARKTSTATTEYDSIYILKILLYLILGSVWISHDGHRLLPVGLIAGILLVQHDKLQIDRKIEYAVLLVAAVLGLVGIGITLSV